MRPIEVLITGGSAGIGRAAALALAQQGARVTLLGRDAARAEAAAQEIRQASGNPAVAALACDLGSPAAVRQAAEAYRRDHAVLDVLINNAGLFLPRRELDPQGRERTFASLHLGHFLLTQLLLEPLRAAPQGRIVCVTCPPAQARVNFDDLTMARGYSTLKAQYQAKGALMMMVQELARRSRGGSLTVNSLLPAYMIRTGLLQQMPWYFRLPVQWFGISPEAAAEPYVWLATAPELAAVSGRHFHGRKEQKVTGQAADEAAGKRLWELSEQMTK
jgi:NAD(P)-dependent dehydrogenase (short-subunit alcohol dehydrogenase family)